MYKALLLVLWHELCAPAHSVIMIVHPFRFFFFIFSLVSLFRRAFFDDIHNIYPFVSNMFCPALFVSAPLKSLDSSSVYMVSEHIIARQIVRRTIFEQNEHVDTEQRIIITNNNNKSHRNQTAAEEKSRRTCKSTQNEIFLSNTHADTEWRRLLMAVSSRVFALSE